MKPTNRQYFGLKYPFRNEDFQKFYLDANSTLKDKVRSEVMHVIFTPKGQRIRMPEFGTDLIKFIFSPNDDISWEAIKNEISESVKRFVDNVEIRQIDVARSEDDPSQAFVRLAYDVKDGNKVITDTIGIEI